MIQYRGQLFGNFKYCIHIANARHLPPTFLTNKAHHFMQSLRPVDLRAKSKELYAKVDENREYSQPSTRTAGVSIGYLRQAITLMTFHVPKAEWLPEDYVRIMRCYQHAINICINACHSGVKIYRSESVNQQINEISLTNINVNHSVLHDFVRDADEFYLGSKTENKDNIEFHLVGCAILLQYYRMLGGGHLSLTAAEEGFAKELNAALVCVESRALPLLNETLKSCQQVPLTPVQLKTLADSYRYLAEICLLDRQFDRSLQFIMKLCDAINALPEPADPCRLSRYSKSHDEFIVMHQAFSDFKAVFPVNANNERYATMPALLNLACESLQWYTKLTSLDVRTLYVAICQQDSKLSILQRQLFMHIIKSMLIHLHCDVVSENGLIMALRDGDLVKEFSAMVAHLEQVEAANPAYSPTLFRKGEVSKSLPVQSKEQGEDDNTRSAKQIKR